MAITEYATAEFAAAQAAVDRHTIDLRQARRDRRAARLDLYQAIHRDTRRRDGEEVDRVVENYGGLVGYIWVLELRLRKAKRRVARMAAPAPP